MIGLNPERRFKLIFSATDTTQEIKNCQTCLESEKKISVAFHDLKS